MDFHVGMLVDDMTAFYLALVDHGDGWFMVGQCARTRREPGANPSCLARRGPRAA